MDLRLQHNTVSLDVLKGFIFYCLNVFFVRQDAPSHVEKRLMKLLEAGVVTALVCMVKQESPALTEACRECIAR